MIKIQINKETRQVDLEKDFIGNNNENSQETLKFVFKDEFVDGQASRIEALPSYQAFLDAGWTIGY